jgi:hypothetical protein
MKKTRAIFQCLMAALLSIATGAGLLPAAAQPAAPSPKLEAPQSVFILPEDAKQGRDPFFPNSQRPYQYNNSQLGHGAQVTSLRWGGVSGPPNHRLVIINNHTFAEGDEEEVITSQGKILVHCLEINDNSVVVEANGQRIELEMSNDK